MFTYWFLTLEEAGRKVYVNSTLFLKLFCKSKICVSLKNLRICSLFFIQDQKILWKVVEFV